MADDVKFIGNGTQRGKKIQLTLRWQDLQTIPRWTSKMGQEYLTLDLLKRKQVSKWGQTHVVTEFQKPVKQEN